MVTLFLVHIFQSSVRSSLLILTYEPEVNSLQDANDLMDVVHSPFIKVSDDWPEEEYIKDAVRQYGTEIKQKVFHIEPRVSFSDMAI